MERSISVKPGFAFILLLMVLAFPENGSWAQEAVVLVVAKDSPIVELSSLNIRKAYLGMRVNMAGQAIRPYRLNSDEQLNRIFLQSVIAMSERSYQRRLLSFTLKFGRPRPDEVDSPAALSRLIEENPLAIGYMWKADAERYTEIRILSVLWQDL